MYTPDKQAFCTIVTQSHIKYAHALIHSIREFIPKAVLHILISDIDNIPTEMDRPEGCYYYLSQDVNKTEVAQQITSKYRNSYHDAFRWSMKSVFLNYLIREKEFGEMIYVDCDIFFFHDPSFLFDDLQDNNVLLTPHWRSSDPYQDFNNFQLQFTGGLYNAGFVGVSSAGTTAMDWWARACEHTCEKDLSHGLFVDQTHLNLLPIYFDEVKILKHRGCNIANWNQAECRRVLQNDNTVLINGRERVVFIHFTASTIRGILSGQDKNLLIYLQKYEDILKLYGLNSIDKIRNDMQRKGNSSQRSLKKLSDVFPKIKRYI